MKLENIEKSAELKKRRDEYVDQRKNSQREYYRIFGNAGNHDLLASASSHGTERNRALHAAVQTALLSYLDSLIADIDGELATYGVHFAAEDAPQ